MRRLMTVVGVVALGSLALAGCGKSRDLFSASGDLAAKAGASELTQQELAQLLNGGKAIRPTREAADFVTGVWVDYSLFAQAVAEGKVLTDSATIAAAMWPDISEIRGAHWHDTLVARRAKLGPKTADSLYNGDQVRLFQHILLRVPADASPTQKAAARKQAEGILAQAKGGADFSALAKKLSQDPGSAADSGYLPPAERGKWVTPFDSAGWLLKPGEVSGVVQTPFGFHIIRRPPLAAVRDRLLAFTQQSASGRLDSLYLDSLAIQYDLKVKDNAPELMRQAVGDPEAYRTSTKEIATFKRGGLTAAEFLRWVKALPPQYAQQVKAAPDDQLKQFARIISQNVLLMRQADSAKVHLTPTEWQMMSAAFKAQIDTLRTEMGLGFDVTDSTVSEGDRLKVADVKVSQYFDKLLKGTMRLRPLPATLASVLRDRMPYRIYPKGIDKATELAQQQKAHADSLRADSLQQQGQSAPKPGAVPGAVQPAPGPAPTAPAAPAPNAPADSSQRR
ncbi:MAG TPA: peptidylprolyl isomerase [Gemmatimonadales bacterium]|nr:peptidylprolyl isomerase [Gemmatimonadales bacterium]